MEIQFQKKAKPQNLIVFYNEDREIQCSKQWEKSNHELCQRLEEFLKLPEIKPKKPSVQLIYGKNPLRVYLSCLGGTDQSNGLRSLGGILGKKLQSAGFEEIGLVLPAEKPTGHLLFERLGDLVEGILLGLYRYSEFKKKKDEKDQSDNKELGSLVLLSDKNEATELSVQKAVCFAESTNLARDWGNKPGNHFTPTHFKDQCQKIAKESKLKFSFLDEKKMASLNMGCFLGVSQGSEQPGYINILEYRTKKKGAKTLLLVGKGLTFDSGGISLKPGEKMGEMKHDMCGGAAVLAAMRIIGLLKPTIDVVGIIPSSENLPSGKAVKPGDVLEACNGKTVEVLNTDAEGRLILSDALAYGTKTFKPDAVVDIATLTGACLVALGSYHAGLVSDNHELKTKIERAAETTGDPVWELPGAEIYEKQIEGSISDLKNIGGREAGSITAGLFLKHFVDKTPWAHLDIAGTAWDAERIEFYPEKGATGFGARLLASLALDFEETKS